MAIGSLSAASPDRVPALVVACGLALTAAVAWLLADGSLDRQRQEFETDARQAKAAILARVETSVALLRATAGLFNSRQEEPVTVEDFRAYVARLALPQRYPGLLGIGFARRIDAGEEARLEAEMRAQGHGAYRVWPQGEATQRMPITFLEPDNDRNRAAIGFDMASNPVRREAMDSARDTGRARASGVIELVQEIDENRQPGFLIYVPVFSAGSTPRTVEERRDALHGFAYTPMRAVDFLSGAFADEVTPAVGMTVHHGEPGTGTLLYRRGPSDSTTSFTLKSTADVAGQPWTFTFHARATLLEALLLPFSVAVAGALLSFILGVLVRRERRSRGEALQALAAERAARTEAEHANRMKDQFLATLSHELRTPLHAIIGWTALLRQPALREEQRLQGVDVIERNARTQSRLIEDLLDMSRIAAGKLTLDMQAVDFAAVAADATNSFGPVAAGKSISLELDGPGEALMVRGDPGRLHQVVSNLLSNALKFTPRSGRVQVAIRRSRGVARLTVTDTGEGIDPRFLERLFDRFAQADGSVTRRHGGLGLGLAIVRQLVELHGGTIEAHSEGAGHGARLVVELPLAGSASVASPAPEPSREQALRGLRVLAVDDDPDARELVRATLASRGAHVRTAASAAEALAALRESVPDVLLSDIGMAGTDGYALIRSVRALPAREGGAVPAAAVTAYARTADRDQALAAGYDLHLAKPLQGDALVDAVLELARRAGRQDHAAD